MIAWAIVLGKCCAHSLEVHTLWWTTVVGKLHVLQMSLIVITSYATIMHHTLLNLKLFTTISLGSLFYLTRRHKHVWSVCCNRCARPRQYRKETGKKNVNVNVSVYSLKSPLSSADFTIYAPGIGTLSYTVSSPLGRIQHLCTLLQL